MRGQAPIIVTALLLAATVCVGTVGGVQEETPGEYRVETSDGETFCVTPLQGEENVSQFYGYRTGADDSRGGETGFEVAQTASLLLYQDTTTGNLSLVFLHGSANESELRRADYRLSGFEGLSWLVQDDPGSFPYDSYQYDDETITGVKWRWQSGTDGGAVGPLGEQFNLSITPTQQQVDTWRVIDGDGSVAGTAPVGGSVRLTSDPGERCADQTESPSDDDSSSSGGPPLLVLALVVVGAVVALGGYLLKR